MNMVTGIVSVTVAAFLTLSLPTESLKLPTYIKPCSKTDKNLNDCARRHGQDALPFFVNGDKKYKIPNLNPLYIIHLRINQGTDQVGLQIELNNAKVHGPKDTIIDDVEVDLPNKQFTWHLTSPIVYLDSDYNVTGRVLLLPIFGSGKANITLVNARYTYNFKYTIQKKNGEDYMVPQKGTIGYEVDRAYIKLENLFNGDKLLGTQMNKFLNENWQDAAREIGPSIAEALSRVIDGILKNICETVPYKDIFLP